MFLKKIITILPHHFLPSFETVCSLLNIFRMAYCNEIEQSNAGCDEIELNIAAKL